MITSLKSLEKTWDMQTAQVQPGFQAKLSDRPPNLCHAWILSTDSLKSHWRNRFCMKITFKLFFLWRKFWFTTRPVNLTLIQYEITCMNTYTRAILAKSALAYENKDKLDKNTFRHNFSSSLKHHSRNAMQRLPEELVVENTLRGTEHLLWMEQFFLKLKEKSSKSIPKNSSSWISWPDPSLRKG